MTNRARVPWRVELGARLRAEREGRGWYRSQLAARLRSADGGGGGALPEVKQLVDMIAQWERGDHAPGVDYRRRYCRVFGTDEAVLFGEARQEASPWLRGGNGAVDVDRERLVEVSPSRVDAGAVEALGLVLAGQRRLEDAAGAGVVLGPVTSQWEAVEELVRGARGQERDRVVGLGSQWAQFAAWLHENTGRYREALGLYDVALRLGVEADDASMVSTALNMRGHVAWRRGLEGVGEMVGLSVAAQRDRRASAGVRALAYQQEARGLAMGGDAEGLARGLDEAMRLADVAESAPDDEPPWTYFYGADHLTLQRGLAYRLLGKRYELDGNHVVASRWYQRAGELFEVGLSGMPADLRDAEWVGRYVRELHELSGDARDGG